MEDMGKDPAPGRPRRSCSVTASMAFLAGCLQASDTSIKVTA